MREEALIIRSVNILLKVFLAGSPESLCIFCHLTLNLKNRITTKPQKPQNRKNRKTAKTAKPQNRTTLLILLTEDREMHIALRMRLEVNH